MKVSVIIPTFNEENVIIDCLKSLSKQSFKDIEIIVVDDGSTDKTLIKIRKLKPSLKMLKQKHLGPGAARNLGARKAKGEILVFIDADMTFDKDYIEKLVEPIIKGKTKGTFSKEEYVSNWENVWARCWNINEGWENKRRHSKNYPNKQKVFRAIKKSEFEKVGGFTPGGYTDDYSLYGKLGFMAQNAPGAIFYHQNPGNLKEIFNHAKWVGKRRYKLGFVGFVVGLIRASFPISVIVGFIKAIINIQPEFLFFKIVYDFGVFLGILMYISSGKGAK